MVPDILQAADFLDLVSSQRENFEVSQTLNRNHFVNKVGAETHLDAALKLRQGLRVQLVYWRKLEV